jgi:mono/diheme cytochrome c family protein
MKKTLTPRDIVAAASRRCSKSAPTHLPSIIRSVAVAALILGIIPSRAADLPPPAAHPVDFVKDIQPILSTACLKCHGPEKQKNGFRVDVKSVAMKGGDTYGVAIKPGNSSGSPLIRYVAGLEDDMLMPPKGDSLTPEQIGLLRAWIDQGAVWPESASAKVDDPVKDHWAFKPLARPPVPSVPSQDAGPSQVLNPIDAFVTAKLAEQGLTLSPEADRRTLIRRLYFILNGLPPTPEEVAAFIADTRPDAYERLVDRLLASPRYGECWGRHWLDVIPFGETHGFEVNTPRENAWPYRDYVIQAFNNDTPYPRFMLEQLAGDAVGADAATGFIVAAAALLPGQIGKDEESKLKARQDELNDMIAGAGGAFLGLTLHCARCHDHKFDPVTQSDYYAIQAIFAGVRHGERPLPTPDWQQRQAEAPAIRAKLDAAEMRLFEFEPLASPNGAANGADGPRRAPVNARSNVDRFAPVLARGLRFTIFATSENNRYEPCLDELEVFTADPGRPGNVALASAGAKVSASGTYRNSSKHRLEHLNDGAYGNDRSWISDTVGKGWVAVEFARPETINVVRWSRDREEIFRDRLPVDYRIEIETPEGEWRVAATSQDRTPWSDQKPPKAGIPPGLDGKRLAAYHEAMGEATELMAKLRSVTEPPMVYAGRFEQPAPTYKLYRGDGTQPREQVTPGAVTALGPPLKLPAEAPERERRLAFARWLGDPQNPLPARVLVNRLWQHHFGEGIVSTPNDFGHNGARPSHPELLDWLASEFVDGGWSIKRLQRLIVLSATWRQASAPRSEAMRKDAGSRLLWRFPPRRLDAEAIRDEMLSASGVLDLRMGGPGYSAFAPNFNYVRVYDPKPEYGPAEWRRMVYQTKVRMAQDSTFGAFDCPDAGQSAPKRSRSTTPLQALNLFNSGFVTQQAGLFAARLQRETGDDVSRQMRRGFQLALNRDPDAEESRVCELLARDHGLPTLCRVLLNSNEFLFIP